MDTFIGYPDSDIYNYQAASEWNGHDLSGWISFYLGEYSCGRVCGDGKILDWLVCSAGNNREDNWIFRE